MIANLKKSKKKGFTLVELIVVIAIIAIIAAVAVPTTIKYVGEARQKTAMKEANDLLSAIETGFSEIVADTTMNGKLNKVNFIALLDESMPTVQNVESVTVAVATGEVTITVNTKTALDTPVSKKYTEAVYQFTIESDIAGTYTNTDGTWSQSTAGSGA